MIKAESFLRLLDMLFQIMDLGRGSEPQPDTYVQPVPFTPTQGIHIGFARFREDFGGFRGGFVGGLRAFRGRFACVSPNSQTYKPIHMLLEPSLATQSYAKFTSLSHVLLHFRSVSQGILTKFRSRFAAVSQPFHMPSRDFAIVKRYEGVKGTRCP